MLQIQQEIEGKRLTKASELLRSALSRYPNDAGLLNLRGVVLAQQNRLDLARKEFERAVRLSPQLTPAWQNLARACQAQTRLDSACATKAWTEVSYLKPDDEECRSALSALQTVHGTSAQTDPSPEVLRALALAYEQLGRMADARLTIERIAVLEPQNTEHLLELARLAELSKDHEGALGYLAHARDLAPQNANIHFLFAMVAQELNLPVETRRSLEQALSLDPEKADYHYALGSVILSTRDSAAAVIHFGKYVEKKPADPKGHFALGIAYFAADEFEKAAAQMTPLLANQDIAPGANYFLGRIARLNGDLTGGLRYLQNAIAANSAFPEALTEMARIHLQQERFALAEAELGRALKLDPSNFQANLQLVILYRRTHDRRRLAQEARMKELDEERSRRSELMLRTLEFRP